jgi:hypothetical protein
MKYKIDKETFSIKLNGSEEEIKKFAKCLVEIIDKSLLSEFEHLKFGEKEEIIDIGIYERIYLNKQSLIYMPHVGEDYDIKRVYFEILKEKYQKAKENFLK